MLHDFETLVMASVFLYPKISLQDKGMEGYKMKKETQAITMDIVAQQWLKRQKAYVKSSTYAIYIYAWQHYLSPEFGRLSPQKIKPQLVDKYLQGKQSLAALTLRNQIVQLRTMLRFAQEVYGLDNDYRTIRLPLATTDRLFIANRTWMKLQRLVEKDDSLIADCIALVSFTGIRLGECCALKRCDIDMKEKILHVRRNVQRIRKAANSIWKTMLVINSPKSSRSCRAIPLPDKLQQRLLRICKDKGKEDFIFGTKNQPMDPRRLQYQFVKYLQKHKIKPFNFHQLRHKFATCCLEQKMDIKVLSELLGHSSVAVTLNYYVHPDMDYKRRQINKFANAY